VVGHSSEFLYRISGNQYIGTQVKTFVDLMQPLGQLGVELFFVLSGFLIGNILIQTFMDTDPFSFRDVRQFWIRRWFRTLPVYWLILSIDTALYCFLKLQSNEMPRFFYYIFIQNLWYPHPRFFFGEAWSLSVEEWFYLTLPVALFLSSRLLKIASKRIFLFRVFTVYLLLFAFIRFLNAFHPINGPDIDFGIRKVVLFRLDAVMYGVLFAWLHVFRKEWIIKIKYYLLGISIGGAAFLYFLLTVRGQALCNSSPAAIFATNAFLYLLMPLFFSLCLPFANGVSNLRSKPLSRFFRHISKVSYSMYLVHYSLVYIPFFYFLRIDTHSAKTILPLYVVYWAIVIVLSSILYKYFEYPVMQLRERFRGYNKNKS
jgi:peptidoglycan/LPS O-acetylase OafA/YrhL